MRSFFFIIINKQTEQKQHNNIKKHKNKKTVRNGDFSENLQKFLGRVLTTLCQISFKSVFPTDPNFFCVFKCLPQPSPIY